MKVLCACEESQAVTIEFRKLGHEAFSCDLQECSGGFPEWHIKGDVLPLLSESWDLIIAFPPCTYLTCAGNRHLNVPGRSELRSAAFDFFLNFVNAPCQHIAIENPVGFVNTHYRKPDQIINPYQFGDSCRKRTCLWLKNLPLLDPDYVVPAPDPVYIQPNGKRRYWVETVPGSSSDRQKLRSKTFPGVAAAMAFQWSSAIQYLGF